MRIAIESTDLVTDLVTDLDGVPVRLWEGLTPAGVRVQVWVHRLQVREDQDCSQFDRELRAMPPTARPTYPALRDALGLALQALVRGGLDTDGLLDLQQLHERAGGL